MTEINIKLNVVNYMDFCEVLHRGPPRYAFKVNIQKAYDTVD